MWVRGLKQVPSSEQAARHHVAPRVGAWIETHSPSRAHGPSSSHPVWVRGLKHRKVFDAIQRLYVAPRVGAWIETIISALLSSVVEVAPRVGAWIETTFDEGPSPAEEVAPRVGAWIETAYLAMTAFAVCRTPCGCVD